MKSIMIALSACLLFSCVKRHHDVEADVSATDLSNSATYTCDNEDLDLLSDDPSFIKLFNAHYNFWDKIFQTTWNLTDEQRQIYQDSIAYLVFENDVVTNEQKEYVEAYFDVENILDVYEYSVEVDDAMRQLFIDHPYLVDMDIEEKRELYTCSLINAHDSGSTSQRKCEDWDPHCALNPGCDQNCSWCKASKDAAYHLAAVNYHIALYECKDRNADNTLAWTVGGATVGAWAGGVPGNPFSIAAGAIIGLGIGMLTQEDCAGNYAAIYHAEVSVALANYTACCENCD